MPTSCTHTSYESGSGKLALEGRDLRSPINFWFSNCAPQNTRRSQGWVWGEKGAQLQSPWCPASTRAAQFLPVGILWVILFEQNILLLNVSLETTDLVWSSPCIQEGPRDSPMGKSLSVTLHMNDKSKTWAKVSWHLVHCYFPYTTPSMRQSFFLLSSLPLLTMPNLQFHSDPFLML